MTPLEIYLARVREIHAAGAGMDETSYYGALENLFNDYGKKLKPKVMCVIQMQNQGAGMPDGGLFTHEQYKKGAASEPLRGQMPARGVIEVKPASGNIESIAASEQVQKYVSKYGQVLVTNLRQFLLLGRDGRLESPYSFAATEAEFWQLTSHPRAAAVRHDVEFTEFINRALLHATKLAAPQDVAWFLASYAREAKARVERAGDMPALASVRAALEQALGMKFEDEKGDHFFRSTLVQTLFYGLFSAWVLWHKHHPGKHEKFNWHEAIWNLRVPMIRALFEQLAVPTKLGPLGLVEIMDWATAVLNRVDRTVFFEHFRLGHAVQYFYEPFLEAFDPELRKQLGVWYTPPEIVQYMVARVDTVLREELDIEDGLADPRVFVLDPCCGTGAYLVEVLNRIHSTLDAKGFGSNTAHELKKAAIERVFGFEILSAPFVVAHLQLGLLLENFGAPLAEHSQERVGVYLTNALTGWEPPKGAKAKLQFSEMEEERDRSEEVKRGKEILVVLGNPPYNGFAGVSPAEEEGLVETYKGIYWRDKVNPKTGKTVKKDNQPVRERRYRLSDPESKGGWGIKKFNLDELYVRFFRLAERRIAEMTGRGVVSFISNASWVTEPSFVILREHLVKSFDRLWIENLHGNRKISEYAPDGTTSETIFAIDGFSAGIQQPVVTSLWVKSGKSPQAEVLFRDDLTAGRASARRADLLATLQEPKAHLQYAKAVPMKENRYSFRPGNVSANYRAWPRVIDLCAVMPTNGLMEKRSGALIDIARETLASRMRTYFNEKLDWQAYKAAANVLTKDYARFDAAAAREKLLKAEKFNEDRLVRYLVRPFDSQWCYYTGVRPIWNEPRPNLWSQVFDGNAFLLTRLRAAKVPEGSPFCFASVICDDHCLSPDAVAIPLYLKPPELATPLFGTDSSATQLPNLSQFALAYAEQVDITKDPSRDIWTHTLAMGYSPAYLNENADGVVQDWPRMPLPATKELLLASAALGRKIAELLDTETGAKGVTIGALRPELPVIAVASGELKSEDHFKITAGWGHGGKDGVTMPGKGNARERDYTAAERNAIAAGAKTLGLTTEQAIAQLGERTYDVFLNTGAWWSNIPANVWEYTIGGYQVIKKWLSYREFGILKRPLKPEEVTEVMNIARRIAAILLLQPELDANYDAIKNNTFDWSSLEEKTCQ